MHWVRTVSSHSLPLLIVPLAARRAQLLALGTVGTNANPNLRRSLPLSLYLCHELRDERMRNLARVTGATNDS